MTTVQVLVSFALVLAVSFSVIGTTSSAPHHSERENRQDVDAATKKFIKVFQLLSQKKAVAKAMSELDAKEQGSDSVWQFPPKIEAEERSPSPSDKAARRHFKVSEPGTGPILNHPLNTGTGVRMDEKDIQTLIDQLLSAVE